MHTDQTYLEIDILIEASFQDILISDLLDLEFDGFQQYEDHILAYIPASRYTESVRTSIEQWIASHTFECHYRGERRYEPQNWNEEWEKTIQPMTIGTFFVRPTWTPVPTPDEQVLIIIDPKMAFGTGYHETTRSILRMLPRTISAGNTVLDVGTGTGILAIAAIKLGAQHVFGFDVDEWSYDNARENAEINGVLEQFEVKEGSFETIQQDKLYDVVLANVNRNMLLSTSAQITAHLKPGGILVLSGLLDVDEAVILQNLEYASLTLQYKEQENEWICLQFQG